MGLSSIQVFASFLISLIVIRKIGVGIELDIYYIAMAVYAFLYSSINWSFSAILAPYLIQRRGENVEGRVLVTILCITAPVAVLLGLTLPLWGKLLFTNYIGEVDLEVIYSVQAILILAYFFDSLLITFIGILQEKNRYILFNGTLALASVSGLLFVWLTLDSLGVYAAALNQLLMKVLIFIWMMVLFFNKIKPYISFDKEIFWYLIHKTKFILLGSLYFKTDEVAEKFIASYLTSGLVSIIGFVQRIYGAVVSILNSAIGMPSMTVFSNYIKDGKITELRPILIRYILGLSAISFCMFLAMHLLGETILVWMMGDKLAHDLIPALNLTMYMLFGFVYFKPINLVLQSLLLSMNKGDIATAYEAVTFTINMALKITLTIYFGLEGLLLAILLGYALTDVVKFYLVMKELLKAERELKG